MAEERRQTLTVGVFLLVLAVALLLAATQIISWGLFAPVVLVLFGIWMLALAALRGANPQKYARGSFGTAVMGLLLIAVGGAWYLFSVNWLYSIVVILLVVAVIAIVAALKRK
ncbi:MAG: hypothetical protein NWF05_09725 [Candidatus Bathyarchaeota archaeon]|nr:hypothetical protein [Candidatus Bathyarchaeota archaeon]